MAMPTLDELKEAARLETPELFLLGREPDLLAQIERQLQHHIWQETVYLGVGIAIQQRVVDRTIRCSNDARQLQDGEFNLAVSDAHKHIASLLRQWKTEIIRSS